jgi:hypothetical protein
MQLQCIVARHQQSGKVCFFTPVPAADPHDLVLEPKKTGAGGGSLLRRAVGVEDLMHPSLLPDIG